MPKRKPHMNFRGGLRLTQAAAAVGVDPDQVLSVMVFPPWNYVFYMPNESEQIFLARLRRGSLGDLQMVGEPLDEDAIANTAEPKIKDYLRDLRADWEAK